MQRKSAIPIRPCPGTSSSVLIEVAKLAAPSPGAPLLGRHLTGPGEGRFDEAPSLEWESDPETPASRDVTLASASHIAHRHRPLRCIMRDSLARAGPGGGTQNQTWCRGAPLEP
ncbi:hypothetical protein GEV33_005964 [Tenebrio molitor]|uniref:Uncharacterized protein n=1 Tax=Tenebrio molitor TaxID=7067 RepID=A0A8J6HLW7_TENMO|nr:hypothetical protein GEV33_005964 [Tenebrio molitor]